jgi:hypothetical protein
MKFILVLLLSSYAFGLTNTTFNPDTIHEFSKNSMEFKGQKVMVEAASSKETSVDFEITEDTLITGARVQAVGACEADEIKFQVINKDMVVTTFIDWYIQNGVIEKELNYPAKLPAGLVVRAVYKNTCAMMSVNVYINFYMHKVKM